MRAIDLVAGVIVFGLVMHRRGVAREVRQREAREAWEDYQDWMSMPFN
jgi:heme exporter protein D